MQSDKTSSYEEVLKKDGSVIIKTLEHLQLKCLR